MIRLKTKAALWAAVAGIALSVVVGLALTRHTTFYFDEFTYYVANRGFNLDAILTPNYGNLIAVPRLIYATVFALFGPDYLVFRLIEVAGIALVAALFFALARRRVGDTVALAPTLLLLFLGSAWDVTLTPLGITHIYSVAAGLGSLLALERRDRVGDVAACLLLTISVAAFSAGLAFLVGVATDIMLRRDRGARWWIFAVPIVLYLVWYVAGPRLTGPGFPTSPGPHAANILLIPNYVADAAAAVVGAVGGLSYDFSQPGSVQTTVNSVWGPVVALLVLAALALRLRRGSVPVSLWRSLAILLAFWASAALVTGFAARYPNHTRYIYTAAVVGLLIAVEAAAAIRLPSRRVTIALFAITVFALAANVAQLRAAGGYLRGSSAQLRAELTAVELARSRVAGSFVPAPQPLNFYSTLVGGVGPWLAAAHRNGSFAFSLDDLRRQPESVRALADATLVGATRLTLRPAAAPPKTRHCSRVTTAPGQPRTLILRPGVTLLRSNAAQGVELRRFARLGGVTIGSLAPGRYSALGVPPDRAPDPWLAVVPGAAALIACELPVSAL